MLTWEHAPIVETCAVQAGYGHLLVLTMDGSLYLTTPAGTTIWRIASGTPPGTLPSFVARRHDPVRGSLIAFDAGTIAEYRLPRQASAAA